MIKTLALATVLAAAPAYANPQSSVASGQPQSEMDGAMHDHAGDMAEAPAAISISEPQFARALSEGGELIVADVLGVVCDFCSAAMNKTFAKRDEVAATAVDLDDKTLMIATKPGASLDDAAIEMLVKKAGYRIARIRRGEEARNAVAADERANDDAKKAGDDL